MNDFNLNENSLMISKLKTMKQNDKDTDLFNIVKDLENRLDNIEMNKTYSNDDETIQIQTLPKKIKRKKIVIDNKINYQDFLIYIILFIILNLSFTIEIIYIIPNLKSLNNPYPNLIIRTLIFSLLIYLYKKYL